MRKMFILGLASVLSFTIGQSFAGSHDAESMTYSKQETLYQKLGGYDAISAVVKDLATRLVKDPQVSYPIRSTKSASSDSWFFKTCYSPRKLIFILLAFKASFCF